MISNNRYKRELKMPSLLIKNSYIITMNGSRDIIEEGAIVIEGNRIVDVGESRKIEERYDSDKVIEADGKIVLPGFINTHTHLFQTLLKGVAADVGLEEWVKDSILPYTKELSKKDCYLAALVGCIEAVESGTTTVLDFLYTHPRPRLCDQTIKAFQEIGIRGICGRGFCDRHEEDVSIPPELVETTEGALNDCERLIKKYDGSAEGRINVWIAPNVIWYVSKEGFKKSKILANKFGTGLTIHMAETQYYRKNSMKRFGVGELEFLDKIGFLGPEVLGAHCVHLNNEEIRILRKNDVKVSHNPISNMYLGTGVAPIPEMLEAGITIGLATDGSASNNNQNMIETLKFNSLLHKVHTRDPTVISGEKTLEMATIDAARALGLESEIGSIEAGKKADLVILDFDFPNSIPMHDPISTLVYSATDVCVRTVIINGKVIMENRRLKTVEKDEILEEAQETAKDLIENSS